SMDRRRFYRPWCVLADYAALHEGDGHGPSLPALVERVHDPLLLRRCWSYYTALRAGDGHGPSLPGSVDPLLLRRCWPYYTALRAGDGHGPSLPGSVERVHDPLLLRYADMPERQT